MLAVGPFIKERLQGLAAIDGWDLRVGTEAGDRRVEGVGAVDIRNSGAQIAESKAVGVKVEPLWTVTLVVRRGSEAASQLDAAFWQVVEALHWCQVGTVAGRHWERLALVSIQQEPEFLDVGLAGCQLVFSTGATGKSARGSAA